MVDLKTLVHKRTVDPNLLQRKTYRKSPEKTQIRGIYSGFQKFIQVVHLIFCQG